MVVRIKIEVERVAIPINYNLMFTSIMDSNSLKLPVSAETKDPIIFKCISDEKIPEKEKRVLDMPPSIQRSTLQAKRLFIDMKITYSFMKTEKSQEWSDDRQLHFSYLLTKWFGSGACGLVAVKVNNTKWAPKAQIRVAIEHDGDRRPWSYEGTLANHQSSHLPTMNLPHEALDKKDDPVLQGVILHQIGHALGLGHQHRCAHSDEKLSLKFAHVDTVLETMGPQNTWKKTDVENYILTKRKMPTENEGLTDYDPLSIMIIPWNTEALASNQHNHVNNTLSKQDIYFLGQLYHLRRPRHEPIAEMLSMRNYLTKQEETILIIECKELFKKAPPPLSDDPIKDLQNSWKVAGRSQIFGNFHGTFYGY